MVPPPTDEIRIALDVNDLTQSKRGRKAINAFLASQAEYFKTKRGHMAMLVRLEVYEKLRLSLGLEAEDGYDGLKRLFFPADPQETQATQEAFAAAKQRVLEQHHESLEQLGKE